MSRFLDVWTLIAAALGVLLIACGANAAPRNPPDAARRSGVIEPWSKPGDDVLRERLTAMQYQVTQNAGTEPPFHNAYWDNHEDGLYVDVVTGEPLFSSAHKYDSGTGWPSFTQPVEPHRVVTETDRALGMVRTEVRSAIGSSHLGHVFDDGPIAHGGKRYCINSAALRFVPFSKLDAEGYAAYKTSVRTGKPPLPADHGNTCAEGEACDPAAHQEAAAGCATTYETAIVAGGCFWGMEDLLRDIDGVIETEVGYIGGSSAQPSYETVHTGKTGHAEAVRVVFDPSKLSFADLLENWFFRMHDPTTVNRQGNDIGSQYRSAIFAQSPEQATTAAEVKAKVDASGRWKAPVVTTIEGAGVWTPAEAYHQDYLEKNPDGYTCHYLR